MLSGVLCLKQNFREGEDFVLYQWARPGSATAVSCLTSLLCRLLYSSHLLTPHHTHCTRALAQAVFKPDFFGVLCAANGVARTLAGAPARCLHLDVPSPGGEARVTAAYLDFRGALWVVLSEGAEVNEVSAGVGAARLLDACVARLGAGVTEQGSAAWAPGSAARACTEATLTRTLSLLAEGGDFEFNVLRADWLAHAYVSAEAAAQRSVAEGPAMWEFRAALLRQLEDLEEDAASGLAEAVNRRAVEAMTDFLSASSAAAAEPDPAGGEGAARRAPRGAGAAPAPLTDTQRIRCLRRLRLSVQGSAIALVLPGAAPLLLVDRIRSNTAAAFTALCLGTVEPALFAPPAAGSAGAGGAAGAANSARMACHFFCPPPPPPSAGAPEGAGAGAGAGAGTSSGEAEAEEAAALGSAALAGAVPPTTVLAARGALAAPCALDAAAARAAPGKLHLVLGAAPLPAFARGEELLRPAPGAAPRLPARPEEGARVRAGGGACAAYARAPHLVALVLVLQPPAPGEEEDSAVGAFADGAAAGALGAVEGYAARAAAQAARAGALAHLGGLLEEGAALARARLAPLLQRPLAGAVRT